MPSEEGKKREGDGGGEKGGGEGEEKVGEGGGER